MGTIAVVGCLVAAPFCRPKLVDWEAADGRDRLAGERLGYDVEGLSRHGGRRCGLFTVGHSGVAGYTRPAFTTRGTS